MSDSYLTLQAFLTELPIVKILFDVSGLDHSRMSGVGTYARNLGQALLAQATLHVEGICRWDQVRNLQFIHSHFPARVALRFPVLGAFMAGKHDLLHTPDIRKPLSRGTRQVVTVHDLAFLETEFDEGAASARKRAAAKQIFEQSTPAAVIAVSNFTKSEILKRYPKLEGRVYTVLHGADHLLIPANRAMRPIAEPYFLFVGNLESRKNIEGLVKAFAQLKSRPEHRDTKLVLVGKEGHGFDQIREACKGTGIGGHILMPGFISSMGLVNYYQWAEAFVYPSHYEGFGFPILEAMRLGCPVITSETSACVEIADRAAVLVDPRRPESIAQAMLKLAEDTEFRRQLIEKGQVRGGQFHWNQCAKSTIDVYQTALKR